MNILEGSSTWGVWKIFEFSLLLFRLDGIYWSLWHLKIREISRMWKRSDATTSRYKIFPQCHNVTLYVNFEIKNNKKYLFQKLRSFSTYKIFLASKIHHLYPRGCQVCIDTHNARYCQIIPKRMIKKTSQEQNYILNVDIVIRYISFGHTTNW